MVCGREGKKYHCRSENREEERAAQRARPTRIIGLGLYNLACMGCPLPWGPPRRRRVACRRRPLAGSFCFPYGAPAQVRCKARGEVAGKKKLSPIPSPSIAACLFRRRQGRDSAFPLSISLGSENPDLLIRLSCCGIVRIDVCASQVPDGFCQITHRSLFSCSSR